MKKKDEEIEEEEKSSYICTILKYKISADRRQYEVRDFGTGNKTGALCGYFRNFSECLNEIRNQETRLALSGSKTLDQAIENIKEFNEKFNKLIAPLKKLEDE